MATGVRGPDVASHQGQVDWQAVKGSGCSFGWTKATGGCWYRNPTFGGNWQGLAAAGLVRGVYHFAFESSGQPYPGPGPEAEADYFLATLLAAGLRQGDMLALDIEEGPDNVDLADWALRWCVRVEQRVGFTPLIYSGAWFTDPRGFGRLPALARYPLWQSAYQASQPAPAAPWPIIAFWQQTDKAEVPGVSGPCDLNLLTEQAGALALYGMPAGAVGSAPAPPPVVSGPSYNSGYPAIAQNDSWSCSCTSARWALWAYAREPGESWLENSMLSAGVVTTEWGLMDASGKGLSRWLLAEYGEYGYRPTHDPSVMFDEVAQEALEGLHPLMIGGRNWGHWSGVRGFADGKLVLANPASGYKGVTQSMSREQFEYLGAFSLVRLVHVAESQAAPAPPDAPSDPFAPYRGGIGSGLLEMMAADGTTPAQRSSTWLPLAAKPADVEQAYGANGVLYYWLLNEGRGYRRPPAA